jgi:hypothetical protein
VLTERTLDAAFVAELPPRLIGDKAWDASALQQRLWDERKIDLIAPKRGGQRPSRRKQDGRKLRRYKRRWRVEWLFSAQTVSPTRDAMGGKGDQLPRLPSTRELRADPSRPGTEGRGYEICPRQFTQHAGLRAESKRSSCAQYTETP